MPNLFFLQTFLTLALLIHPLSLSAQNTFSLSLDVNSAAGDQAVTSLNASADQVVAIQIFGNNIRNANGLAVRFEYDATQVVYEGFEAGDVLPNAQALPEQGTGFVEIGIASLGGQATANSGQVGTVRFRTTAAFSGTAIRLVRAELSRGGRFETIMPNIRIALQGAPTPAAFSLSLDVNGTAGDQAVTSVNVSTDEIVAIQIFGQDIRNANGVSIRFEYDASQVVYEGFDAGNVLPNAQALPVQGPGVVQINLVSFGGQATVNSGLVGTIRFRTMEAFSGTAIRLVRAELGRGGQIENVTMDMRVELKLQVLTPDFNRDGMVNFADFLQFTGQFGARRGDGRYEAKYDLDSDGKIGFGDFLIFGSSFGQEVSTPGGGGGRDETQITITDANLRAAMETALRKASGASISRAEMASLTRLEAPNSNISDLTGLEFATRLTSLDLGTEWVSGEGNVNSNHISDLSPLSDLTNLTWLSLSNNDIADITPLSNLTNLTTLNLNDNFVSNITLLSNLINLTNLNLGNNDIADITPLSNLTNLTTLNLNNNFVSDSDIALLSGLTNLRSLYLGSNDITDVAALSALTNLEWLGLYNNSISNITSLSGLTNLRSLNLGNNDISDVAALSGLTSLEWLSLYNNSISNITPLSGLTNLRSLTLGNNDIADVAALSGLTSLEWLRLYNNSISNIASLSGLTSLELLDLFNNSISNIAPLVTNTGLGAGDIVDVTYNPLSATSINTHIPALQGRGVDVLFGTSKPAVEETEPRMPHPENEDIVNGGRP